MISHIVLFQPKRGLSRDQVKSFAQQLDIVVKSVPSILRARVGKSLSVETGKPRNFGDTTYSFAAVLEFADRDGLVAYLNHPAHQELGRLFWLSCERTIVCEVETLDPAMEDVVEFLVNSHT